MYILIHISILSYIHGMVQNLRTVPFQRESSLSVGELKEGFIEEAGPGESPMKWIKFGWKKERAFQED